MSFSGDNRMDLFECFKMEWDIAKVNIFFFLEKRNFAVNDIHRNCLGTNQMFLFLDYKIFSTCYLD